MRLFLGAPLFAHAPHATRGANLYHGATLPLRYRAVRTFNPGAPVLLTDAALPLWGDVANTCRAGFIAGNAGESVTLENVDLSAYAPGLVYVDLRHCAGHVENDAVHPQLLELDASGDLIKLINGAARFLAWEQRSGGIVRFSFQWIPATDGYQPETFTLVRTAGPSSPATQSINAGGAGVYTIDSAALLDSSTYTFEIRAVNTTETITRTLLEISDVQADASGPPAVTVSSVGAV